MKKLFFSSIVFLALLSLVIKPAELSIGEKAPSPDLKWSTSAANLILSTM
jgi:hypothetical protein